MKPGSLVVCPKGSGDNGAGILPKLPASDDIIYVVKEIFMSKRASDNTMVRAVTLEETPECYIEAPTVYGYPLSLFREIDAPTPLDIAELVDEVIYEHV